MLELAQAHASYRFVVRDEDTEEKRILVSYNLTAVAAAMACKLTSRSGCSTRP